MCSSRGNTSLPPSAFTQSWAKEGKLTRGARTDPKVAPGTIGAARLVRQWAQLSQSGDVVEVEAFNPASTGSDTYLASLDLEVRSSSSGGFRPS